LGTYDPVRWRAFRYLADRGANVEFNDGSQQVFHPEPGRAYWLITRSDHRLDTEPISTLSVSTEHPFEIVLAPGWNQIGNPFAFPVARADVLLPAHAESLTAFDPNAGTVGDYSERPVGVLEPFAGYFVYNAASSPETLRVRPVEMAVERQVAWAGAGAGHQAATPAAGGWFLRLIARSSDAIDATNLLGIHPDARDQRDALDDREPPPAPGSWVRLAFAHSDWHDCPGLYRHDLRAPGLEGNLWEIEITSALRGEAVEIQPQLEGSLPADLVVRLFDPEQSTSTDLRRPDGGLASYSVLSHGPDRLVRLTLLAGTEAWVAAQLLPQLALPAQVALENTPNPFNGATRIRFALPQSEVVTLAIYNVRGERVATLARGEALPAGYHVRWWNGRDETGRPASSGVYFCRLVTNSGALTRRMMLLK
jgi:hypothetical protein